MSHQLMASTLVTAASQKGEQVFPLFLLKLPVLYKRSKQYH